MTEEARIARPVPAEPNAVPRSRKKYEVHVTVAKYLIGDSVVAQGCISGLRDRSCIGHRLPVLPSPVAAARDCQPVRRSVAQTRQGAGRCPAHPRLPPASGPSQEWPSKTWRNDSDATV